MGARHRVLDGDAVGSGDQDLTSPPGSEPGGRKPVRQVRGSSMRIDLPLGWLAAAGERPHLPGDQLTDALVRKIRVHDRASWARCSRLNVPRWWKSVKRPSR